MSTSTFTYVGDELDLFAAARRWKSYFAAQITPFLGSSVLEVGAGIGATTKSLVCAHQSRWLCLDPDARNANRLAAKVARRELPASCQVAVGVVGDVKEEFDTVLYIDVLEHIEDDRAELEAASARLAPGGRLIILSPACQWLYSPFDRAIGHYRRYTASSLAAVVPPHLDRLRLRYLDSLGAMTSAANRLLLSQSMPTQTQIAIWDRLLVPASRVVDPLVGFSFGRSILGVWQASR